MNMTPVIDVFTDAFRKSMIEHCDFSGEEELTPGIAARFFAAMGKSMSHAACVGTKQFLMSHDVDEPFIVRNGVRLNRTQPVSKEFLIPFGKIELERQNFQAYWGGESYQPLDEKWGMVGEFATESVRECILFYTAHLSPTEIVNCLSKSSLFHPSKTAIDNILKETGERTEAHFERIHSTMLTQTPIPEKPDVIVGSMDGANILTREPGIKKGRPSERPKDDIKTSAHSSYRNVMTGSFSQYRAADSEHDHQRIGASYISRSPEENFPTFRENFEREFTWYRERFGTDTPFVLLHDGGRNIWKYCDENPLFQDCLKLLDFYHATEHLSWAAEAIFGKQSQSAKQWYRKWKSKLKDSDGGAQCLIRSMEYYQPKIRGKTRRENLERELTFFRRNAERMDYKSFRDKGFPIGSGPVEAACKTIVKDRLCKSGQRWSLDGAQHILHLRAIVKSGRWESYWKEQEEIRLELCA